jgi:hypothetical protein
VPLCACYAPALRRALLTNGRAGRAKINRRGSGRNSLEKAQPSWLPQKPLKLRLRNSMIKSPPHNLTRPRSDTTTLCMQRVFASAICLAPPQYGLKASNFRFPLLFLRLCGLRQPCKTMRKSMPKLYKTMIMRAPKHGTTSNRYEKRRTPCNCKGHASVGIS